MKRHKCNFKPCLIYIDEEKLYDLASYCCECGKIGAAGNNDDRVTNEEVDGRIRWRLKTSSELASNYIGKLPVIEVINEPDGTDST